MTAVPAYPSAALPSPPGRCPRDPHLPGRGRFNAITPDNRHTIQQEWPAEAVTTWAGRI